MFFVRDFLGRYLAEVMLPFLDAAIPVTSCRGRCRTPPVHHRYKIVFLEDGRIRQTSSHDESMAVESGHYRRFVELRTVAA